VVLDAAQPLPFKPSTFDRILVDAPCSGTGTLARNPEIRWRISEDDIHTLATQQKLFLTNAARVERDENEAVIAAFVATHTDFKLIKTTRTWPHRDAVDGFFIASLTLAAQQ
jgi:16S rRNA (cytosine967-C5)-methyltransferase